MALSAALRLLLCGGTCWKATSYFLNAFSSSSEHSLSRMWSSGAYPFDWGSWVCRLVQALISSLSWRVLRFGKDCVDVVVI